MAQRYGNTPNLHVLTEEAAVHIYISKPIKPVKSFDITLDYAGMTMAYSTYSTSSKNQSATESNEPISTRIWGDYYHIESKAIE